MRYLFSKLSKDHAFLFFSTIAAFLIIKYLFQCLPNGFDLTDESFYLHWISNPWIYKDSVTQFGYVYYPFFRLLSGNIYFLRIFNIFSLLIIGYINCYLLFIQCAENIPLKKSKIVLLSGSLAICLCVYMHIWLPTPSYNSLNFFGLLILSAALMYFNFRNKIEFITIFSLSFGLWVIAMAKPTSWAAAALFTFLFIYKKSKKRAFTIFSVLMGFLGLSIASAYLIDGAIILFLNRIRAGVNIASSLGQNHAVDSLFRLDALTFSELDKKIFILFLIVFIFFVLRKKIYSSFLKYLTLLFLVGVSYIMLIHPPVFQMESINFFYIIPLLIPFYFPPFIFKGKRIILNSKDSSLILFLLILMPFFFSIGTGNNFWTFSTLASFFWMLGLLLAIAESQWLKKKEIIFYFFISIFQFFVALIILSSSQYPYRQPMNLLTQKHQVFLGKMRSPLFVSQDLSRYIISIQSIVASVNRPGVALLDFTGRFPGAAFVAGLNAPGKPWLMTGYPGSNEYAKLVLQGLSCVDISRSMVLYEPENIRNISADLLKRYKLDLEYDYLKTELNPPHNKMQHSYQQFIYIPKNFFSSLQKCLQEKN